MPLPDSWLIGALSRDNAVICSGVGNHAMPVGPLLPDECERRAPRPGGSSNSAVKRHLARGLVSTSSHSPNLLEYHAGACSRFQAKTGSLIGLLPFEPCRLSNEDVQLRVLQRSQPKKGEGKWQVSFSQIPISVMGHAQK